jgi:hypothetical protein
MAMRDSKRKMLYSVLNCTYGTNSTKVRSAIRTGKADAEMGGSSERIKFSAATVVSSRCNSFLQAQRIVDEWVAAHAEMDAKQA